MTAVPKTASRLEKKTLRKSSLRLRVLTSREATASCCTCASATSVPHPRVKYRVEYVHEQVDQHEEQGPIEDHALYRSVVPAAHGLVGVQADPGPREDRLRNDRPCHDQSHLQPYHRYRRQHGVSQGVLYDHPPRNDPLGPGHAKIVSVMIAPAMTSPTCNPITVIVGNMAFLRACFTITRHGTTPLALAVLT